MAATRRRSCPGRGRPGWPPGGLRPLIAAFRSRRPPAALARRTSAASVAAEAASGESRRVTSQRRLRFPGRWRWPAFSPSEVGMSAVLPPGLPASGAGRRVHEGSRHCLRGSGIPRGTPLLPQPAAPCPGRWERDLMLRGRPARWSVPWCGLCELRGSGWPCRVRYHVPGPGERLPLHVKAMSPTYPPKRGHRHIGRVPRLGRRPSQLDGPKRRGIFTPLRLSDVAILRREPPSAHCCSEIVERQGRRGTARHLWKSGRCGPSAPQSRSLLVRPQPARHASILAHTECRHRREE